MCDTEKNQGSPAGSEPRKRASPLCAEANFLVLTEELAASNTDGSHGRGCLDGNKLNSLKVLLFTKFPVGPDEEKEKVLTSSVFWHASAFCFESAAKYSEKKK